MSAAALEGGQVERLESGSSILKAVSAIMGTRISATIANFARFGLRNVRAGAAQDRAALGIFAAINHFGRFLLAVVSGAKAQGSGSPAHLLLVVLPALGLRTR